MPLMDIQPSPGIFFRTVRFCLSQNEKMSFWNYLAALSRGGHHVSNDRFNSQ